MRSFNLREVDVDKLKAGLSYPTVRFATDRYESGAIAAIKRAYEPTRHNAIPMSVGTQIRNTALAARCLYERKQNSKRQLPSLCKCCKLTPSAQSPTSAICAALTPHEPSSHFTIPDQYSRSQPRLTGRGSPFDFRIEDFGRMPARHVVKSRIDRSAVAV